MPSSWGLGQKKPGPRRAQAFRQAGKECHKSIRISFMKFIPAAHHQPADSHGEKPGGAVVGVESQKVLRRFNEQIFFGNAISASAESVWRQAFPIKNIIHSLGLGSEKK